MGNGEHHKTLKWKLTIGGAADPLVSGSMVPFCLEKSTLLLLDNFLSLLTSYFFFVDFSHQLRAHAGVSSDFIKPSD
jgi:hypothetical protein